MAKANTFQVDRASGFVLHLPHLSRLTPFPHRYEIPQNHGNNKPISKQCLEAAAIVGAFAVILSILSGVNGSMELYSRSFRSIAMAANLLAPLLPRIPF